eukprot:g1446.t1
MSSLRKYLKRKSYKERSQPASRRDFGLLEKHKDYIERAKVYHEHQAKLENLQREAEERNPNEFYFSMEHERTRGGIPINVEKELSLDEEVQLKSKDLNFVNMRIQQETKEIARLRSNLHALDNPPSNNTHVVFVDTEKQAANFHETQFFGTSKQHLKRGYNRSRKTQTKPQTTTTLASSEEEAKSHQERILQYSELTRRTDVLESLKSLANELWIKKQVIKGDDYTEVTLSDGSKFVKFKRIRK